MIEAQPAEPAGRAVRPLHAVTIHTGKPGGARKGSGSCLVVLSQTPFFVLPRVVIVFLDFRQPSNNVWVVFSSHLAYK